MPRRRVLVAAFACLAALGLAVAPWTVSTGRLSAAVAKQLRTAYGLGFAVKGRTTIALLPMPRLKFENVALSSGAGATLVEAGQLRGELRLLPMLIGQIEISELSLNEARIRLEVDQNGDSPWDRVFAYHRERVTAGGGSRHIRRLIVTNATLTVFDQRRSFRTELSDMNLVANWPAI